MQTLRALSSYMLLYALAVILIFSMPSADAAPAGEPSTASEGLAATLEISKINADSANSIPTVFSAVDVENVQPYASTEVDTEAELAPTSLPMTREEIALAEVAAVVAELTTATAAERKAQEKASDEEREGQVRRRAEEAKRQAIEHEIASAVEVLQDEEGGGASTTLTTRFADIIGTTATAIQQTTASPTTSDGPTILNELVRAAAAANKILAAALNVATTAGTNITITTTSAVDSADTTTASTIKPDRAANTEVAIGDGLLEVSDSETLPEGEVTWQPSEIETISKVTTTATTVNFETADAVTTTPIIAVAKETTHSEPTPNANISYEINRNNLLVKSLESEGQLEAATNSPLEIVTGRPNVLSESSTTTLPTEDTTEALGTQTLTETVSSLGSWVLLGNFNNISDSEDTKNALESVDHEGAESKNIITTKEAEESTEATQPTAENEVEVEIKNLTLAVIATQTDGYQVPETTIGGVIDDDTPQRATSDEDGVTQSSTSEPTTVENSLRAGAFEIAKVEEVKRATFRESQLNTIDNEITTASNSPEGSLPDSTEPLETLIAVESEARAPNKYIKAVEAEVAEETATTTNSVPEATTAVEETTSQAATETTTTAALALGEETLADESTMSSQVAVTTKASEEEDVAKTIEKKIESDSQVIKSTSTTTKTVDEKTDAILISLVATTTTNATEATLNENEDAAKESSEWFAKSKAEETEQSRTGTTESTNAASTVEPTIIHLEKRIHETIVPATETGRSSTETPLAAFTITPEATTEELLYTEASTAKYGLEAVFATGSPENVGEATTLKPAEYTNLAETFSFESGSITSDTTAVTKAAKLLESTTTTTEATTAAALEAETGIPAITTTKIEVETKTPLLTEQQAAELGTTIEVGEQPLYMRTLDAQQREISDNVSAADVTNAALEPITETRRATTTKSLVVETNAAAITTAKISTDATDAGAESTSTIATTSAVEPDITATKIDEPETTTTEPENSTTTTPKSETTTTTTLSPMSLIIAEHEARSLERTPPRVSRIVSDDGVEVLSGYSIVHHMHAAAMAVLAAAAGA